MKFLHACFFVSLLLSTTCPRPARVQAEEYNTAGRKDGSVEPVQVPLVDMDSLWRPTEMTLEWLVGRLEEQLSGIDRPLLIERRWKLVENYYRYEDGRRELVLLDTARTNLKWIYLLNQKLAGKGEISDVQVLSTHNTYLRSELEYLATKRTVRDAILNIVRLANLELTFDKDKEISHTAGSDSLKTQNPVPYSSVARRTTGVRDDN